MTIDPLRPVEATGRVVAQFRDRYVVRAGNADHDAVLGGRFRHEAMSAAQLPAVGDDVLLRRPRGDGAAQITGVLPRRSAFKRKAAGDTTDAQVIAANIDIAIIATALPHDVNLRRIERYLTLVWESGATPIVALTKSDLSDDLGAVLAEVRGIAIGADVVAISVHTGQGMNDLIARLPRGSTAVLIGSSGVGKSTLVNALLGADRVRTSAVGADGEGRHTTTHRELHTLANGAALIDTPGMRELQLGIADDGFDAAFGDIVDLSSACRFADCGHDTEPDCAVRAAIASGTLDPDRLASWRKLKRELAYFERKVDFTAAAAAKGYAKSLIKLGKKRIAEKYD